MTNTIFSSNGAAACAGGSFVGANNLEWLSTSCAAQAPAAGFTNANPLLGPLALNAPGTTPTLALQAGSAAIDAGNTAACAGPLVNNVDQRGVARPIDGDDMPGTVCDMGAYEAPATHAPYEYQLYLPLTLR